MTLHDDVTKAKLTKEQEIELLNEALARMNEAFEPSYDVGFDWINRDQVYMLASWWRPMRGVTSVKSAIDIDPKVVRASFGKEQWNSWGEILVKQYRQWWSRLNADAVKWREREARIHNRWWKRLYRWEWL